MPNLVTLIEAMPTDQRKGAIAVLDAISRPMTPREIEAALLSRETSRTQRKAIVAAVKNFRIVAIIGGEE